MLEAHGTVKHWATLSPLPPLLLHLGLSVRDTVCQPIHAWPACRFHMPTQNTLSFTETWENSAFPYTVVTEGSTQGNMVPANQVKC